MARNITFQEFAKIINNATAVILDNNAVTYPYVEEYETYEGERFYDRVEINYHSEYDYYEHSFYSDDNAHITIEDDGSIKYVLGEDYYNIQVLQFQKLV